MQRPFEADAVRWSVPPNQRAGRPLLLAFHGHRGDEAQLAVAAALLGDVVVATPRAPYRLPSGGWSWFELSEAGIPQAERVVDDIIAWLQQHPGHSSYGVLGLSQGGAVAMALLRARPDLFDYGLQLSGFAIDTTPAPALAARRPPFFSAHGGRDTVIPADRAADTARWLREHTTLTERIYPTLGHSVEPIEIAEALAFIDANLNEERQSILRERAL
jgi:phospholipase/carboxylesterase